MPHLTFRERLRMSWELTWPLALIDAAVVMLIHGVIETQGATLDSAWLVLEFFVVAPWVVRRALARRYGEWTVMVARDGKERVHLRYEESFKAMWLLTWRILPLAIAAALVISAIVRVLRIPIATMATLDPLQNALGLSVVDSITSLVLTPFLIRGMLGKKYRGFRLELIKARRKK